MILPVLATYLAFYSAGYKIASLATYKLTELFYKHVADGEPLDIALQKAKLEFINSGPKQHSLPYYWAAATLTGRTDSIIEKNRHSSWYVILFGICLILTAVALIKRN